ncbi:MAG TPA: hypothetical protein VK203_02910 [Nostocaceae cyanobacterium]|nr:hypothetical protein [Nostocaceae cyanobacterium]
MKKFLIFCWCIFAWVQLSTPAFALPLTNSQCEWHYVKVPGPSAYHSECVSKKNDPENLSIEVSNERCTIYGERCFAVLVNPGIQGQNSLKSQVRQVIFYPYDYGFPVSDPNKSENLNIEVLNGKATFNGEEAFAIGKFTIIRTAMMNVGVYIVYFHPI